jgi:hypothetical protein
MTVESAEERLEAVRARLAPPWAENEERVVEARAFAVFVRKRGHRYDLDDAGEAVASARSLGATGDWLRVAEDVVVEEGFNVNRRGAIFVPAVEGRDLASLAVRLGACAEAVQAALLETAAQPDSSIR